MQAFDSLSNPWRMPIKERLYSIASGAPVPLEMEDEILGASRIGAQRKHEFVEKRLRSSQENFFDPIKKLKLPTMECSSKTVTLTTTQGELLYLII